MFKDYYQILDVPFTASKQEIRDSYRRMSLKWHPDRNPDLDVTNIMQDINEAYKILSDDVSKTNYDKEYLIFIEQKNKAQVKKMTESWTWDYEVKDENLKNDINSARAYAKDLVDVFFNELKNTSKDAAKGALMGFKWFFSGRFK
jgi:curved DNA-binding protein CbpA